MKTSIASFALFCSFLACAQATNLIRNSDFDRNLDQEYRYDAAPGAMKRSIITEDRTWNKCLKIESLKYTDNKQLGKVFYTAIRFGGDKKNPGFEAKPNTIYTYSIELKGDLPCRLAVWGWKGTNYWKDMKQLKVTGDSSFKPSREWTVKKVTFQTGADTKFVAVGISIWGAEKYKNLPELGKFVLLDKVKVTEKTDLLAAAAQKPDEAAASAAKKKAVIANRESSGFVALRTPRPASVNTEFTVIPDNDKLTVKIRCHEPQAAKIKHDFTGLGGKVWQDDLVEIFFGPVSNDRELSQFVVSAGGGRWMGRGRGSKIDPADYQFWSAKTALEKDGWTAEVTIPYQLLGWEKRPAPGTVVPFNLARTRTPVPELSSFAFAGGNFHDVKRYAVLWLDDPGIWFAARKAELTKAAAKTGKELADQIARWELNDPADAWRQSAVFQRQIESARLGRRTHVLVQVSPSADPAIPMIPAELADPPKKISIRAAVNEFKPLPLAVTNLLNRPEEYRIVIGASKGEAEEISLKHSDGTFFPPEKIRLYRGVRVKDSDGKNPGLRYDPLAPMDITSTVVAMPKEAAPVWAIFNTAGVKPGVYSGVIRVIPLGEETVKEKNKWKLPIYDLPLELEVLPFEISREPAIPQSLFAPLYGGRETFRMMMDYDINTVLISPWRIGAKFGPDGSIQSSNLKNAEKTLDDLKKFAAEIGRGKNLRICVAYSAYIIFRDIHGKKKFKAGTPEWKKAWQGYVKLIDGLRIRSGLPKESFSVEIQDEPKPEDLDELLAAAEAAHEIAPDLNLMVTIAAWQLPLEKLRKFKGVIYDWCFWGTKYFTDPELVKFQQELRAAGRKVSLYSCDTSMRLDLHKYYITHAWRALAFDADMCNLYEFITHRNAVADWKRATYGSTALMASGQPVSTIRLECLRIGSTDIKYMKKLAEVLKEAKSAEPGLRSEAEKFLKETPMSVGMTRSHDPAVRAAAREMAIDLILKLTAKQ